MSSTPEADRTRPTTLRRFFANGPLLVLVSAMAFSTAGFFTRSVPVDAVTMLFWRNLLGGSLLLPFVFRQARAWRHADSLRMAAIILLSGFGSICYIAAFALTSVADVSIIYAAAPMVTALLAWIVLRERVAPRTALATLLVFAGVALTTFGGIGSVSLLGDGLALLMTLALSAVAVLSRGRSLPPLPIACASSLLAAVAVMPARPALALTFVQLSWLAAFGAVTMAVALPCYLMGLRTVPAARAMLISAWELPLAPFWVWAAYGELPAKHAIIGGTIVAAAVFWELSARLR